MSNPVEPYVMFRNVNKSYDGKTNVVDGLDLDIARGEFLTLLGPSGSGKTTTLMMLAGFEAPSAGTIQFDGKPITSVPTYKRDFGMVFQNYALFPHMTVAENLAFPLRMRRVAKPEITAKVRKTLDIVQLGHLADRKPGQLSGGQAQRVALARSIVFDPRMVLMDEPLGALDKQLREQMQLEIKRLHHELDITMLYVTHDQTEALTMSDRIAVFNDGKIQQIGTPSQMYGAPENRFVAGFMGENNCLDGKITQVAGHGLVSVYLDEFAVEMQAVSSGNRKPGDRIKLMVRPERVRLVAEGSPHSFTAKVTDTIYYGDHVRLVFGHNPETALTTRVPQESQDRQWAQDDTVTLSWDPQAAIVFTS
jgi:putative spermidine/putrescine transport system ATP-binding protein